MSIRSIDHTNNAGYHLVKSFDFPFFCVIIQTQTYITYILSEFIAIVNYIHIN